MSMTDPIADFLARIRNGIRARKQLVELPRSNMKLRIAEILRDEGFVQGVATAEDKKQGMLKLELRYDGRTRLGQRDHRHAPRVASRPAPLRSRQGLPKVRNGLGIAILSTSQGVMTDKEARNKGVGGEVLCEVW